MSLVVILDDSLPMPNAQLWGKGIWRAIKIEFQFTSCDVRKRPETVYRSAIDLPSSSSFIGKTDRIGSMEFVLSVYFLDRG